MEFWPWPLENPKTAIWTVNLALQSLLLLGAGWLVARIPGSREIMFRRKALSLVVVLALLAPAAACLFQSAGLSWSLVPAWDSFSTARGMETAEGPAAADQAAPPSGSSRAEPPGEKDQHPAGMAGRDTGGDAALSRHLPWETRITGANLAGSTLSGPPWAAAIPWANLFLLVWLSGTGLLLLRLAWGYGALMRFRKRVEGIADDRFHRLLHAVRRAAGSRVDPAVHVSDAIESPLTLGIRKPGIVFPRRLLARMSTQELRTVILHEFAHVRNGDVSIGLCQRLTLAFFWWNPLVHIVNTELSAAMELVCDRFVLQETGNPGSYAACLVRVAEGARAAPALPCAPGLQNPKRNLEARIRALFTKEADMYSRSRGMVGAALILSFLLAAGAIAATSLVEWPGAAVAAEPRATGESEEEESPLLSGEEAKLLVSGKSELSASQAVDQALDWLARHQHPEGYWDCDDFQEKCSASGCSGGGHALNDVGATGLALLAFQGMGSSVLDGRHKKVVRRAVKYLCDVQDVESGSLAPKLGTHYMYNHGVATLALTEAYGLSRWPILKEPVQRALDFIHRSKNPGKAWRYGIGVKDPRQQNDVSVTTWMLLSLASAKEFGFTVDPKDLEEGLKFIDEMTDTATGRTGYMMRGAYSSREAGDEMIWPFDTVEAMTGAGMFSRCVCANVLGGMESHRGMLEKGAALLGEKPPKWEKKSGTIDYYYWLFGSLAMYQAAGDGWLAWKDHLVKALVPHQRKEGCAKGSWDPQVGPWGDNGGRVYSTALAALALEVVARYDMVVGSGDAEGGVKAEKLGKEPSKEKDK